MDCIFCKIVKGEIPSTKIYEDEKIIAFNDLEPKAPVHILIVPKTHIASMNEIDDSNSKDVEYIFKKIPDIAQLAGVKESGYRLIANCGEAAGQTVMHLHFHLLGGARFEE